MGYDIYLGIGDMDKALFFINKSSEINPLWKGNNWWYYLITGKFQRAQEIKKTTNQNNIHNTSTTSTTTHPGLGFRDPTGSRRAGSGSGILTGNMIPDVMNPSRFNMNSNANGFSASFPQENRKGKT